MAKSKSLVKWDDQLAAAAQEAVAMVAGLGGGQFFSIRGGSLTLGGATIPGNEVAVVVLDHVLENVFYDEDYDVENPAAPKCYAFGRDAANMVPHTDAEHKVSSACKGCPNNEFGSSERGRGKACKNRIRLACIPAGTMSNGRFEAYTDPEVLRTAQLAYFGVPPTSIGAWGQYVKGIVAGLKRPPFAVFTKIKIMPDPKKQVAVVFELLGPAPQELADVLTRRHNEAAGGIIFSYPKITDTQPKPSKKRKF
jgi:hypothetical protein